MSVNSENTLLLPEHKLSEKQIHADEVTGRDSVIRSLAYFLSMLVFIVVLLYSSGAPFIVASVLQQCGKLPDPENQLFWSVTFPPPLGPRFSEHDEINLLAVEYLMLATPWFVIGVLWEQFIIFFVLHPEDRPTHVFRWNDALTSIALGILNLLVINIVIVNWTGPFYSWLHDNIRITDALSDTSNPRNWWIALVFNDFTYYCTHRAYHQMSWLWVSHVVHHSTEEYNLTTALRQPVGDMYTPAFFLRGFIAALFIPPELWWVHGTFNLLYQFWLHTQLIPALPVVEWVFVTPSLHRIHHARNVRALGKNYGSIFSVWDRIFRTFEPEVLPNDYEPIYFGIIPPLNSWDPWWAHIHHVYHMCGQQWKWHGIAAPFRKWTPPGGKAPKLGQRMNPYTKFDAVPNDNFWKAYVGSHYIFLFLCSFGSVFGGQTFVAKLLISQFSQISEFAANSVVSSWIFVQIFWGMRNLGVIMSANGSRVRQMHRQEVFRHIVAVLQIGGLISMTVVQKQFHSVFILGTIAVGYAVIWLGFLAALRFRSSYHNNSEPSTGFVGYTHWYHNSKYQ